MIYSRLKNSKGFTLIELLFVISIIGVLSSIILSSLNAARNKAKDAKIKEDFAQLINLMALNYSDYGSYCQMQYAWVSLNGSCSNAFPSSYNYGTKAQALCNDIIQNAADDPAYSGSYAPGALRLYNSNSVDCNTSYSLMTFLNNGKWYCVGSSGSKGEYSIFSGNPGCYNNP